MSNSSSHSDSVVLSATTGTNNVGNNGDMDDNTKISTLRPWDDHRCSSTSYCSSSDADAAAAIGSDTSDATEVSVVTELSEVLKEEKEEEEEKGGEGRSILGIGNGAVAAAVATGKKDGSRGRDIPSSNSAVVKRSDSLGPLGRLPPALPFVNIKKSKSDPLTDDKTTSTAAASAERSNKKAENDVPSSSLDSSNNLLIISPIFGPAIGTVTSQHPCRHKQHTRTYSYHGRLYVSSRALCYYSANFFGFEQCRIVLPWRDVAGVVEMGSDGISILGRNGTSGGGDGGGGVAKTGVGGGGGMGGIGARDGDNNDLLFTGLKDRDVAYRNIRKAWMVEAEEEKKKKMSLAFANNVGRDCARNCDPDGNYDGAQRCDLDEQRRDGRIYESIVIIDDCPVTGNAIGDAALSAVVGGGSGAEKRLSVYQSMNLRRTLGSARRKEEEDEEEREADEKGMKETSGKKVTKMDTEAVADRGGEDDGKYDKNITEKEKTTTTKTLEVEKVRPEPYKNGGIGNDSNLLPPPPPPPPKSDGTDNLHNSKAVLISEIERGGLYTPEGQAAARKYGKCLPVDMARAWEKAKDSKGGPTFENVVIRNSNLPCTLDQFHSLFLSDTSVYSIATYQKDVIGDTDLITSRWSLSNEDDFSLTRTISYVHPVNAPMAPPSAAATKEQILRRFGDCGLILETQTVVNDVPMADCFYVDDRIVVEPTPEGEVEFTALFEVRFVKRTMFKKIISTTSGMEVSRGIVGYEAYVRGALEEWKNTIGSDSCAIFVESSNAAPSSEMGGFEVKSREGIAPSTAGETGVEAKVETIKEEVDGDIPKSAEERKEEVVAVASGIASGLVPSSAPTSFSSHRSSTTKTAAALGAAAATTATTTEKYLLVLTCLVGGLVLLQFISVMQTRSLIRSMDGFNMEGQEERLARLIGELVMKSGVCDGGGGEGVGAI